MIINEILKEKDKTQKRLSENSKNMHDYFEKARIASEKLSKEYGFELRYL